MASLHIPAGLTVALKPYRNKIIYKLTKNSGPVNHRDGGYTNGREENLSFNLSKLEAGKVLAMLKGTLQVKS